MWRWLTAAVLSVSLSVAALAGTRQVELSIDGRMALADLVVPDGKTLADGVLVLTHGTLAHKDMELIESLQGLLAERGIVTLAPSLTLGLDRREGMYDCAAPHTHRHEDAVAEIGAWISWLRGEGANSVWLFGHSRGGNQAALYAAQDGKLDKLVLLAPGLGRTATEQADAFKTRFKADLAPLMAQASQLIDAGKGGQMMDLPGFIYCPAGKASAGSLRSYYGGDPQQQTMANLARVSAPVLVIAGTADTVVPDVPERIGKIADGKKITLQMIEDAGHMFLDFHAEDAADMIAEFVAQPASN